MPNTAKKMASKYAYADYLKWPDTVSLNFIPLKVK